MADIGYKPPSFEEWKQEIFKGQNPGVSDSMLQKGYREFLNSSGSFQLNNTADNLLDFNSPFYQQYRSYLGSVTPNQGTNALLAPLLAGGGNYAASQQQAQQLQQSGTQKRNDFLNNSVKGFASQNIGIGAGLQGQAAQLQLQKYLGDQQIESQSGGFLDFLGAPLGSALGYLTGGLFGGATSGGGR